MLHYEYYTMTAKTNMSNTASADYNNCHNNILGGI